MKVLFSLTSKKLVLPPEESRIYVFKELHIEWTQRKFKLIL